MLGRTALCAGAHRPDVPSPSRTFHSRRWSPRLPVPYPGLSDAPPRCSRPRWSWSCCPFLLLPGCRSARPPVRCRHTGWPVRSIRPRTVNPRSPRRPRVSTWIRWIGSPPRCPPRSVTNARPYTCRMPCPVGRCVWWCGISPGGPFHPCPSIWFPNRPTRVSFHRPGDLLSPRPPPFDHPRADTGGLTLGRCVRITHLQ